MPKINPKFDTHRADTLNPNNDAFWQSRGYESRPINWQKKIENDQSEPSRKCHFPYDGRDAIDSMFDPLCKEDY